MACASAWMDFNKISGFLIKVVYPRRFSKIITGKQFEHIISILNDAVYHKTALRIGELIYTGGSGTYKITWWRHQMETFSALMALCAGKSLVTSEFPSQRPVTRSFHVFFDLRLNKRLSKQPRRRWFETKHLQRISSIRPRVKLCQFVGSIPGYHAAQLIRGVELEITWNRPLKISRWCHNIHFRMRQHGGGWNKRCDNIAKDAITYYMFL